MKPADLLEIDWEVGVFKAVRALWLALFPPPPAWDATRVALLSDHAGSLGILAQLVAGEPVRVLPARDRGGVRGRDLLIPPWIDAGPDPVANRGLLLLRVVHDAAVRRFTRGEPVPTDANARAAASDEASARALAWLREELPLFGPAWDEAGANVVTGALVPSDTDDATTGAQPGEKKRVDGGTEHEAPAVEELRRILLDPKEQEQKVLQHTFEKVETLDSWEGNVQSDDGADELDDHLEALQEVDLRDLLRGGEEAQSVYKADLDLAADVPDVEHVSAGEVGVPYDEWDHRTRRYREAWCTVYPTEVSATAPAVATAALQRHRKLVGQLRRRLEDHRSIRRPANRQRDGEHPDVDALVDRLAEVRAGRTGDDRLYVRQRRQRRDFATTVLLDVSLSADSWVDDRRVLDVARDAVLVLGEVADQLGDRLEILAFASSTRNRCRVFRVKGWTDPWALARGRLGALEPQGYTRIGPALRHATAGLGAVAADEKLLLLVSDGKPNDYDRYEGAYGVADVRMALREAVRVGVTTHALAIDTHARSWLPSMLGAGRWHVLPEPDALVPALTEVYGRLTG